MPRRCLVVLCGILSAAALVQSQEFRATLTGRVLDSGGSPVPNARVRVTNTATAETRDATTDAQGNYVVPLLNPSTYTVKAEGLSSGTT